MIDIVFLLIIFFITVTQITKVNQEKLPLPNVSFNEEQTITKIIINVRENGDIVVDGKGKSLAQTIYYLGQQIELKGNDPTQVRVTLRSDFRAKAATAKSLIREMKSLGLFAIQIGVEGK